MKKIYDKGGNIWPTQVIKDNLAFVINPYAITSSNSVKYHICVVKDNIYAIPVASIIINFKLEEDPSLSHYIATQLSNPHDVITNEGKYLATNRRFFDIDSLFDTIDMCVDENAYNEAIRQNI